MRRKGRTDGGITEKELHKQVCAYINAQYPNVIYTSDMSGVRASIGIAIEIKRKTCKKYKIPDLIILHPAGGYCGLVIEVKRSLEDVFKKCGQVKANKHIQEQAKTLTQLSKIGYKAAFGCGFKDCVEIIYNYMNGKDKRPA